LTRFVIATKNNGKIAEARDIFAEAGIEMLTPNDVGCVDEGPEETGQTFAENAKLKTLHYFEQINRSGVFMHCDAVRERGEAPEKGKPRFGFAIIAEDSGLEIDALGGRPGLHSARFMGNAASDKKNEAILKMMEGVPIDGRTARFACAACAAIGPADGTPVFFCAEESLDGVVSEKPFGSDGFGYDPIFLLPQMGLTMAQLSEREKNKISHRGIAFRALIEKLRQAGVIN